MQKRPLNLNLVLSVIIISQFFCTTLWFVGNSISGELEYKFNLGANSVSLLTSMVQFGFLAGTLIYAFFSFADRYSPSKVFFISACLAALSNLGILYHQNNLFSLGMIRFFTGCFLAGIYPVGMKIAADYYKSGLGKSLSYLVGALVLGTALPHLLKSFLGAFNWESIIIFTSFLSLLGGVLVVFFIPNGPFQKPSLRFNPKSIFTVFKNKELRSAALGYFGHMWELYAFWAFVPFFLTAYNDYHISTIPISISAFAVIGIGLLGCIFGGKLSTVFGSHKIAYTSLLGSGVCCLLSPFIFYWAPPILFVLFMLTWGILVIADSPLFSSLVANSAESETKGTALTIVTCIGFGISIISIQLIGYISIQNIPSAYSLCVLFLGPLFGLLARNANYSIGKSK